MLNRQTPADMNPTLLLVDDDVNVTHALRRVLHNESYRILTAQNGTEALQLLENNPVDLIVSDARMPGMDGATLLSKVRERWPACIRILLTGHTDIEAAITSINEGRIYRYLSKPWHNDEICAVVDQGLAYRHAEQERLRLLRLTREQNLTLRNLNKDLEQRVQDRTAELRATATLLEQANAELEKSYVTAAEVFSSLINQRLPKSRQTNRDVIDLVRAFCTAHDIPAKEVRNLEMAAALYNIGKLTWRDELIALPSDRLSREQRADYQNYPGIGEKLLMALDPAQEATVLIRHHKERWDGNGFPDGLSGEAIPWGARLLGLAVAAVEMQAGMVQTRQLSRDEALDVITQQAGRTFDPSLCKAFAELVSRMPEDGIAGDESTLTVGVHALEPGMIMIKKLYSAAGTLLLSEGQKLTDRLIERLQEFEYDEGGSYQIHVRRPDSHESAP